MIKSSLIFDFYSIYLKSDNFRTGTLICASPAGNMKFMATSGLKNYQGIGSCNKKGKGGIPPCELVGIKTYTVATKPIAMPKTKGVEGNFYQIFPFNVLVLQYEKKTARGDFGIHADMNIKGTSGCIGLLPGEHWQKFEELMKKISSAGEELVDLFVPMGY